MKRFFIAIAILVVILGVAGFGYVWNSKRSTSPPEGSIESRPVSVGDESGMPVALSEIEDADAGSESESIGNIITEIEAVAMGDEAALEGEYMAESENLMEGAAVIEQLGTSYDETSY